MKSDKLHKIAFLGLFTLLAAVPVLQSCDDDEKQKAVDLRYRVEDSYLLPADGTTAERHFPGEINRSMGNIRRKQR